MVSLHSTQQLTVYYNIVERIMYVHMLGIHGNSWDKYTVFFVELLLDFIIFLEWNLFKGKVFVTYHISNIALV